MHADRYGAKDVTLVHLKILRYFRPPRYDAEGVL